MLINDIVILKSFPTIEEIRNVKFNLKGLNVIVDKQDSRGNGIGKTTFLRLIDIAMGATEIEALYYDKEQGLENKELKNFIEKNKVFIRLTLLDTKTNNKIELEVDLFNKHQRRINGKLLSQSEYTTYLNKIIFENENKKPSFRSLIGKFVRIKMDGDNDKFLKFSSLFTKADDYQNIYNFLFKFQDEKVSEEILGLKKIIKELEKEFKTIKLNFSFESEEQISTALNVMNNTLSDLKIKQKNYIDKDIILDEDKIISNRNYYSNLNSQIEQLKFEIDLIKETISKLEEETNNLDNSTLDEFYNELKNQIQNLSVSFNKLVDFNDNLRSNKLKTNKKILNEKETNLNNLIQIKNKFYNENKDAMFLIESGTINDYLENQSKILDYENKKGKAEEALRIYSQYENKIKDNNTMLEEALKKNNSQNIDTQINKFNDIFRKFSAQSLNATYYLYKTSDNFPLKISNAIGPISTGNKKTAIAAFDLSYFQFAKENNIACPHFIVHDVLENIDKNDLDKTLKLVKEIECQYIIAMLKEKADNQSEISESNIILTLSENDKLFKI